MSSQLPIRVEENLQSCIVIVFEPFVRSECDIHDLVQLLVSLSQIHWHVFRIVQGLQTAGRLTSSPAFMRGRMSIFLTSGIPPDKGNPWTRPWPIAVFFAERCPSSATIHLFLLSNRLFRRFLRPFEYVLQSIA